MDVYCSYLNAVLLVLLCAVAQCQEPSSLNTAKTVKRVPRLTKKLNIDGEHEAWVFDSLFSREYNEVLGSYLSMPHAKEGIKNLLRNYTYSPMNGDHILMLNTTRWIKYFDTRKFETFQLWKTAKPLIEKTLKTPIYLENVQAEYIRSLDPKPVIKDCDCDENRYLATFFVIPTWQNNNYGQISLYSTFSNNSQSSGKTRRLEVVQTVHPKPSRMVVWPSCVPFVKHPPTVSYYQYITSFAVTFTTNEPKAVDHSSEDVGDANQDIRKSFRHFKFTNDDADREIDHGKHLTRSFYDSSNNGIFVFDDLFTPDELKQIKQHALENAISDMARFITAVNEDGDNVGVISMYNVSEFASCPLWKRVYDLVCHVSGESGWYPYDVALNQIHSSGHTRIHSDAQDEQFEYTYLLYLNPNVGSNEFGETTWFERVSDRKGDGIHEYTYPGGEEFESFAAVKPKYGRVVIFRNIIQHSARPLGSQHFGNRYSFAVKVSRTMRISLTKQIYETGEPLQLGEAYSTFFDSLVRGEHDDETRSRISTEKLEKILMKFKSLSSNRIKKESDHISMVL